jgi:hypothetical protein
LEKSADRGCHFCGMLWGNIFDKHRGYEYRHLLPYPFARGEVILSRYIIKKWIEESGLEDWNRGDSFESFFVNCGKVNAKTYSHLEFPCKRPQKILFYATLSNQERSYLRNARGLDKLQAA